MRQVIEIIHTKDQEGVLHTLTVWEEFTQVEVDGKKTYIPGMHKTYDDKNNIVESVDDFGIEFMVLATQKILTRVSTPEIVLAK
jgi:hypothetical protein